MCDRTDLDRMISLYESQGFAPTPQPKKDQWFAIKEPYVEWLKSLQERMGTLNRLTGMEMDNINDHLESLLANLEELPDYV